MSLKNQRKVTAGEMFEQTRRKRLRSPILESRSEPVLPEDALKLVASPKASTVAKSKAS
jgi:hypothetical protein